MDFIKELINSIPNDSIKLNPKAPEFIPQSVLKHSADTGLSFGAVGFLMNIVKVSKEKSYADALKNK